MKYYITTFYDIRFLKPYQIPISTAVWQPKYYLKNGNCFVDKNGVMNGIYEESLSPKYLDAHDICTKGCQHTNELPNCPFLTSYSNYLSRLDFSALIKELERTAYEVQKVLKFTEEPEIILLVYEKEDNQCSERKPLQKLFKANGLELKNWNKNLKESV